MAAPDAPRPVSIPAAIDRLTPLRGRSPTTTDDERADAFAELAPYRDGGVYIGHWGEGSSEWERHPADEVVAVVDGATTIILLVDEEEVSYPLGPAGLIVVPELITRHGVDLAQDRYSVSFGTDIRCRCTTRGAHQPSIHA